MLSKAGDRGSKPPYNTGDMEPATRDTIYAEWCVVYGQTYAYQTQLCYLKVTGFRHRRRWICVEWADMKNLQNRLKVVQAHLSWIQRY